MNKNNFHSTVNGVYFYVIDLTVEALKKYLEKFKNEKNKYNIPNELKTRWQARINCLFHSLEGSWSRFQEYGSKNNEIADKIEVTSSSKVISCFPLVCTLSWDILRQFRSRNEKISGFKSWVWNCLIGRVVSEGIYPQQSFILNVKKIPSTKKIQRQQNLKYRVKYKRDIFNQYALIISENFNLNVNPKTKFLLLSKKIFHSNNNIITYDSEFLGSEFDKDIESQLMEETEENTPSNFILSVVEKVYRRNTKWRVFLKDGILHISGKDLLFNLCKCEFYW
nr:transcription initiation factor IIA subunit 1 [Cryptomonas curvata]